LRARVDELVIFHILACGIAAIRAPTRKKAPHFAVLLRSERPRA
jgi:hypothetical protein